MQGITSIEEVLKLVEMVGDDTRDKEVDTSIESNVPAAMAPQGVQAPSKVTGSLQTGFSGSGLSLEGDD
jgi:MSHA biogenesis protein MshE